MCGVWVEGKDIPKIFAIAFASTLKTKRANAFH
jgi:hypothetical protein